MIFKYLVFVLLLSQPIMNPDNVKPGDWFTPTGVVDKKAEQRANYEYHCAVREARTGLKCE